MVLRDYRMHTHKKMTTLERRMEDSSRAWKGDGDRVEADR